MFCPAWLSCMPAKLPSTFNVSPATQQYRCPITHPNIITADGNCYCWDVSLYTKLLLCLHPHLHSCKRSAGCIQQL
jgi:hypothetical protein